MPLGIGLVGGRMGGRMGGRIGMGPDRIGSDPTWGDLLDGIVHLWGSEIGDGVIELAG